MTKKAAPSIGTMLLTLSIFTRFWRGLPMVKCEKTHIYHISILAFYLLHEPER